MNWENIVSPQRTGTNTITDDPRTEFQRDFDRLIFSSGFRRLQNKTQVFPLPGTAFVHNRLTHSLEVASVGRSLGKIVGEFISKNRISKENEEMKYFYLNELQNVIAAACLAHDIGNPPFGHSGEKAISRYFIENADTVIGSERLRTYFDKNYWNDLINFEGNANGFRFLTHNFNGKISGGLRLTYSTLAATLKYPCESSGIRKGIKHRSKFNFFQTEKKTFLEICKGTNMEVEDGDFISFKRHPFVYLTEAADDICYNIIDMEDAQRLGILPTYKVEDLFKSLIKCVSHELKIYDYDRAINKANTITDDNDRISYLRAKCINAVTLICADRFKTFSEDIISGKFNDDLFGFFKTKCQEMKAIKEISEQRIYNHQSVIKIEIVGYKVLYELLSMFIPAVLNMKPTERDQKIRKLIPFQFSVTEDDTAFNKAYSVLDYISGMTDTYATQLYKDLSGIDIARHQ